MGGYRRFCVQCGGEMKQGARFCANCGHAAAASTPQPAVTSDHDLAPGNLQMPPPAPPWDTSAVPLDGALFPPHGSAYPPDRPPFRRENAVASREDAGFPPGVSTAPPDSFSYPRGAAPSARSAGPPPEGSAYPRPGTSPPFPHGAADAPPVQRKPFPRKDGGVPFPQYDAAAPPFARNRQPASPLASPSKDLALPPGYPAATAARPPGPPLAAPAPPGTETAQFTADDFAQSWMNDVGFSPQWEPSASLSPVADAGPAADSPERHHRLLAAGLFALVAAVIVVPALLIAHSFHSLTGGSATAPAKRPTPGASAAAPSVRAAAASLATLLAQTAADRSSIVGAVGAVEDCTAALGQAPQVFQNSAASRQRLLQRLATLPGRSALPAAMLQALTGAWQASAAVDTDLAKWAQDEAANGCKPHDHADANYQTSNAPDVQATNDKAAFVGMWNTIAAKYGLTRYQTSQL